MPESFSYRGSPIKNRILNLSLIAVLGGCSLLGSNQSKQTKTSIPKTTQIQKPGGTGVNWRYLGTTDDLTTAANAANARDRVAASLDFVNSELARLGAASKRIESHNVFVSKLQDAITSGIGNLVDADLAKESAYLQSLQVKQQLGTQALSIANQAPQTILSLFK